MRRSRSFLGTGTLAVAIWLGSFLVAGCGGGEHRSASPSALEGLSSPPPGAVLLVGSLQGSELPPPYPGYEVEIAGVPGRIHPDAEGLVASYVGSGAAPELRVLSPAGGVVLVATGPAPARPQRLLRLDPSILSTARCLVRRARPDLAHVVDRASPAQLEPLMDALREALGLDSGAGRGTADLEDFSGSVETDAAVRAALEEVLPALEAATGSASPAQAAALSLADLEERLGIALQLRGRLRLDDGSSVDLSRRASAEAGKPRAAVAPSAQGDPEPTGHTMEFQRRTFLGGDPVPFEEAMYASDQTLVVRHRFPCEVPATTGCIVTSGTLFISLPLLPPATPVGGPVRVETTVANCWIVENDVPVKSARVERRVFCGDHLFDLDSWREDGFVTDATGDFFFGEPPQPGRAFEGRLGSWVVLSDRSVEGNLASSVQRAFTVRNFSVELKQDPDPWDPEGAEEVRFHPEVTVFPPNWEPGRLQFSGTARVLDPQTDEVIAELPLSGTGLPGPDFVVASWDGTGLPAVVAGAPDGAVSKLAEAQPPASPSPEPTPSPPPGDGVFPLDASGVLAFTEDFGTPSVTRGCVRFLRRPIVRLRWEPEEIEPSFQLEVTGERLDPPPRHGDIPGFGPGESRVDGKRSEAVLVVELIEPIRKTETIRLRIEAHDMGAGGHDHGGWRAPAGAFSEDIPPGAHSLVLLEHLEGLPGPERRLDKVVDLRPGSPPLRISYVAPFASGVYRATATFVGTTSKASVAPADLAVRVPGLVPLGASFLPGELGPSGDRTQGVAVLYGASSDHPENHSGTPALNRKIARIARDYWRRIQGYDTPLYPAFDMDAHEHDKRLFVNDVSLPGGGVFHAFPPRWYLPVEPGHFEHRLGRNADLITDIVSRGTNLQVRTAMRDRALERSVHDEGLDLYNEVSSANQAGHPENAHYHVRMRSAR